MTSPTKNPLRETIDAGAIWPSKSPFSSNVVLVWKKDGSFRFCIDFRKLNSRTIKDAYTLPRIHLLVQSIFQNSTCAVDTGKKRSDEGERQREDCFYYRIFYQCNRINKCSCYIPTFNGTLYRRAQFERVPYTFR